MIKPVDRKPILGLFMLQLLINVSSVEVLRLYWHWHTATYSHLVMALQLTLFMMIWWSICTVLTVFVLEHLVERKSSF
jgi:ABC-type transport system involved in cytochrome c biogenesis permease subunit